MTQLSRKGREKRRDRYQALLLEARLLGFSALSLSTYARGTPNSYNIRAVTNLIKVIRR